MLFSQLVFLQNGSQVCSGWKLGLSPTNLMHQIYLTGLGEEQEAPKAQPIDTSLYLIKRGYFINFLGLCGFILFSTIIIGQKKHARRL